jgi:hypothetical protein
MLTFFSPFSDSTEFVLNQPLSISIRMPGAYYQR